MKPSIQFSRTILGSMLALALIKAEARSLRVTSAQIVAGQTASVAVELTSDGNENAMGFSLSFNPVEVQFLDWKPGNDAVGVTVIQNASEVSQGRMGFLMALPVGEDFQAGNRQLLVLRFRGLMGGQTSSVAFGDNPVPREISTADASTLSATYQAGAIMVSNPAPSLPQISLSVIDTDAAESGPSPGVFRLSRTGSADSSIVLVANVSGSATSGVDYAAIVQPLILPAGSLHLDILVLPVDDSWVEGPELVRLELLSSSEYVIESTSVASITIHDNDAVMQGTPPVIVQSPIKQSVPEGGRVTFQVSVTGTLPMSYQWYRDGQLLPERDSEILVLTSVTPSDAGFYSVEVWNGEGRATSNPAELEVQPKPPAVVKQPESQDAIEGSEVRFSVEASGTPPLTFQWRKDGQAIAGATAPTLSLNALMAAHSGVYAVEVRNRGGSVLSQPARLTVQPKPILGTPPVLSAISRQLHRSDVPLVHIPFTVADAEDPVDSLIFSAVATPAGFFAADAFAFFGSGSNRWLTVRLPVPKAGQTQITVMARDPEGLEGRSSFELVLEEVPPTPEITSIPDQVLKENDPPMTVSFLIADQDTPVARLLVRAQSSDPALFPNDRLQLSGRGHEWTLRLQPGIDQYGTAVITVTVSDGVQAVSTAFTATVKHINELPTITPLGDLEIEAGAFPPVVSFTVADAETPAAELKVVVESSNRDLLPTANIFMGTYENKRTLTFLPTPGSYGVAAIAVRVVDTDGGAASAGLTLAIRAPAPRLEMTAASGQVVITWPADGEEYALEMNRDLEPRNWIQVDGTLKKGPDRVEYRARMEGGSAFWRLRRR